MNNYKLYTETTAPEGARQTMQEVKSNYGFIPNLMATMAESPALLKAYAMISQIFEETSFSNTEKLLCCWLPVTKTSVTTVWRHTAQWH